MKCFVTFRLKPGVTFDEYAAWFREVNVPAVRSMSSISAYRVWRTTGGLDGDPPFDVLEEMEVTDRASFERELEENPAVAAMLEQWQERVVDPVVVYGEEVPQDGP